jgi:CHAT domain-containing protein/tetratricopeptide (TPR) repeat protein
MRRGAGRLGRRRFAQLFVACVLLALSAAGAVAEDRAALEQRSAELFEHGKFADALAAAAQLMEATRQQFPEDSAEMAAASVQLGQAYHALGRLDEAEAQYQRALAITEQIAGPEDAKVALALLRLADLRTTEGRADEAAQLSRRALGIAEQARGPDDPGTASFLTTAAMMLATLGNYQQGEALARRAIAIDAKDGPGSAASAEPLFILGEIFEVQNRSVEAEAMFRQSLRIRERTADAADPGIVKSLTLLGASLHAQNRLSEAAAVLQRALAITASYWPGHPRRAETLAFLASVFRDQGRTDLAVPIVLQLVASSEAAWGPRHLRTADALGTLALLYKAQGKYDAAAGAYRRALAIRDAAGSGAQEPAAQTRVLLANLLADQQRYAEAEAEYAQALPILEKTYGAGHPEVGRLRNNIAVVLVGLDRYAEAYALHRQGIAILESALGAMNVDVATALAVFGAALLSKQRYAEAEALYQRALAIVEKRLGADSSIGARLLGNLGTIRAVRGDWRGSYALFKRAVAIYIGRAIRSVRSSERDARVAHSEIELNRHALWGVIAAAAELVKRDKRLTRAFTAETFEIAQWAMRSQAAAALSQMAARFAKRGDGLAERVRQRQDLIAAYQAAELKLIEAAAAPAGKVGGDPAVDWAARRADIDARLAAVDADLARQFPQYEDFANPKPLSVAEAQRLLRDDEVLVQFVFGTYNMTGGYVWAVTRTDVRWAPIAAPEATLTASVQALRCGLDDLSWEDEGGACQRLLNQDAPLPGAALPFDLALAHRLYAELFGPIHDLTDGKHMLIVPFGALASLPFSVLVTTPPDAAHAGDLIGYAKAGWLGLAQPISILPSAASLRALRHMSSTGRGSEPFIGFGDPALQGNSSCRAISIPEQCPGTTSSQGVAQAALRGSAPRTFRSAATDVAAVSALCPLPDTKHELACVAASLGAGPAQVHVGPEATETAVKRAPLDRYRIVHFATHGLLASDTESFLPGVAEPAIVLSPPAVPSEEDDGLLTASEVAQLQLDADWVILSACNTAAAEGEGGEALSGLARAFFYAGARALLVSHWQVYSNAAAELIARAVHEVSDNPTLGRAEAMRRSMAAIVHKGGFEAHPAFWAPFVVIGEGGAPTPKSLADRYREHGRHVRLVPTETWRTRVFEGR